ncbi:hypothetical protein BDR04DRAFT_1118419 [Suillus decipiens]|nr:hypothetical protein BDR04DRAFT_1118419 [Suillus decipiens]
MSLKLTNYTIQYHHVLSLYTDGESAKEAVKKAKHHGNSDNAGGKNSKNIDFDTAWGSVTIHYAEQASRLPVSEWDSIKEALLELIGTDTRSDDGDYSDDDIMDIHGVVLLSDVSCISNATQMVCNKSVLEQFSCKMKSIQWWKLLNVAYQNKFQFELWPDKVPLVGPDFNYHSLSTQYLKLLIVPYIKCKALQYYGAELKMEAENLLKLQCRQGCSNKTLDDIIDKLDIAVSEIEIVPWPKDHIKQCEKDDPKMFDIPLVTSAFHIVLQKLTDSKKFKFKHSILKGLLQIMLPIGISATEVSQVTTCRGLWQVHGLLADSLLIKCPADQQLESEADSLNASDSHIRKKSKALQEWLQGHVIMAIPHNKLRIMNYPTYILGCWVIPRIN